MSAGKWMSWSYSRVSRKRALAVLEVENAEQNLLSMNKGMELVTLGPEASEYTLRLNRHTKMMEEEKSGIT